ncbi:MULTISPECIES: hypothetical protein [unclassified Sphingopyxis]|uniref:hypothetical protein n=1 Tax=unclassified Sphingopyxis TaxID=2614943 RepID=UPI002858FD35|nr:MULTISPECIES: hypothetical protein [unclassified Sphingopyxis]MDR7061983.1 hypothetical protein [Sphingopyxis sp. BE235]MDR7182442.1 hypothetical protein [Sphingopyxis sp. BE249]
MSSTKIPRSAHHMVHVEETAGGRPLGNMEPGQVFVREGAPHMMLSLDSSTRAAVEKHHSIGNAVFVVNLLTGSAWPVSAGEVVYPATETKLLFKSNRKNDQ